MQRMIFYKALKVLHHAFASRFNYSAENKDNVIMKSSLSKVRKNMINVQGRT